MHVFAIYNENFHQLYTPVLMWSGKVCTLELCFGCLMGFKGHMIAGVFSLHYGDCVTKVYTIIVESFTFSKQFRS